MANEKAGVGVGVKARWQAESHLGSGAEAGAWVGAWAGVGVGA